MLFYIHKKLKPFSAAHRLIKSYTGKCRNLHGHNYSVDVKIKARKLDRFDFVMDFDDVKDYFDQWVQTNWDHATLVSEMDRTLIDFLEKEQQHHFIFPGSYNTTAERLAEYLFHQFTHILNDHQPSEKNLVLTKVCVYESETASATYRGQKPSVDKESSCS